MGKLKKKAKSEKLKSTALKISNKAQNRLNKQKNKSKKSKPSLNDIKKVIESFVRNIFFFKFLNNLYGIRKKIKMEKIK